MKDGILAKLLLSYHAELPRCVNSLDCHMYAWAVEHELYRYVQMASPASTPYTFHVKYPGLMSTRARWGCTVVCSDASFRGAALIGC